MQQQPASDVFKSYAAFCAYVERVELTRDSILYCFWRYLERSDLRPNSIAVKLRALGYFVRWFGLVEVGAVTSAMAEDYKAMLGKGRLAATANSYWQNFVPFWGWLYGHGRIKANPFYGIKRFKTDRQPPRYFEVMDLERMVRGFDCLWRVRLALGMLGCRRGEMLNLHQREIHLETSDPHLMIQNKPATSRTWEWKQKNRKVRYVALPESIPVGYTELRIHQDLVELGEHLPYDQPYVCLEPKYYQRMCRRIKDETLTLNDHNDPTGNLNRLFRLRQEWAGVAEPKRYHELRAAFITSMLDSGMDIKRATDAAGNVSIQNTAVYDRKKAMNLMAEIAKKTQKCYMTQAR